MDHEFRSTYQKNRVLGCAAVSFFGNAILFGVLSALLLISPVILTGASPGLTSGPTKATKSAIAPKAADPASVKKAAPVAAKPVRPYLAVDRAYVQDARIHIVFRNTAPTKPTSDLFQKGKVQVRQGKNTVTLPLSGLQPQKGKMNTWSLDTGLAFQPGQPVMVSLQNVPGDKIKQIMPFTGTASASMRRPVPQPPPKLVPRRQDIGRTEVAGAVQLSSISAQSALSFVVAAPVTGTVWPRCSIQTVSWKQPEAMAGNPTIKLVQGSYEYRVGYHSADFDDATEIYSVRLSVPGDVPVGDGARIAITGFTDGSPSTVRSAPFTIEANRLDAIRLDTPNGGENYHLYTTHRIAWAVEGRIDSRTLWELDLIKDGRVVVTYPNRSMPGLMVHPESGICSFKWGVNAALESGSDYTMRIRAVGTSVSDASDRPFSIGGLRPGVDLRISTPPGGYDDYPATPGWRFDVPYYLYNAGADPTPPFEVAIYLSEDINLGLDDIRLTTVRHTHNPDSPQTLYMGGTFVTLPETITTGRRYYLIAAVDWNDQVAEWDERNNDSTHVGTGFTTPVSIFVHPSSSAARDLVAGRIQLAPSYSGGNPHRLSWHYDIIDFVFPYDSYTYDVRMDVTGPSMTGRVLYDETVTAHGRSGGMNRLGGVGCVDYSLPTAADGTLLPGTYTFRLTVDGGGSVDELLETNNTVEYVFEVPAE